MKLCFIGACGHYQTVTEAIPRHPEIEVTAVCSAFKEDYMLDNLISELCKHGISPKRYEDEKMMITVEKPDILVVDGIFSDHAPMAEYALKMGIHVYCEKPVAFTEEECVRLMEACHRNGAKFCSMQTARYEPSFFTMKKLLEQGAIGEIRLASGQKSYVLGKRPSFYQKRETYGGTFAWVGIHAIDLILWMTGKKLHSICGFASRQANSGNGDLESTAVCAMQLGDEVTSIVTMDYLRPEKALMHGDDRIRIAGTKGYIEALHGHVFLMADCMEEPVEVILQTPPAIFDDFLNSIIFGTTPLLTAEESIYSTYAAIMATKSFDQHKLLELPAWEINLRGKNDEMGR